MVEMRWKMGRANKGSPSIPQKLQYRYWRTFLVDDDGHTSPIHPHEASYGWSEWLDVPKQFAASRTQGEKNG
jgi:hypothetical protein